MFNPFLKPRTLPFPRFGFRRVLALPQSLTHTTDQHDRALDLGKGDRGSQASQAVNSPVFVSSSADKPPRTPSKATMPFSEPTPRGSFARTTHRLDVRRDGSAEV